VTPAARLEIARVPSRMRVLASAPMWTAIALYAVASQSWGLAGMITTAVAAGVAAGPRVDVTRSGQLLLGVLLVVGVYASMAVLGDDTAALAPMPTFVEGVVIASLLYAAARLVFAEPLGGPRATYALVLLAVIGCGITPMREVYVVAVIVSLLTTLWSLRALDPGRPGWDELPTRSRVVSWTLPFAAAALAVLAALPLVPTQKWLERQLQAAVTARFSSRTGFSDRIRLGQMARMLESETVVLRLDGGRADYLRGAVFDTYGEGYWEYSGAGKGVETPVTRDRPARPDVIEVRRVAGKADRFFLPLEAAEIATRSGVVVMEPSGVAMRLPTEPSSTVWFVPGPRATPPSPPGPRELTLKMHPKSFQRLQAIAVEWTEGAGDAAAKLEAISRRLQAEYTYSLSHEVTKGRDPVVDFLTTHKQGHCEYFAAALALLARSVGIPTRVVAGYRVAERAPWRSYWLVREKNAHAWVEAHVGDRWITVDATPASALPQNQEHEGSAARTVFDSIGDAYDAARGWLLARSARELWGGAFLTAVVLTAFQLWRGGRGRKVTSGVLGQAGPPRHLVRLMKAVTRSGGRPREPWEPLEAYARALAPEPRFARAAELITAWAAHSYGGAGDAAVLARAMNETARDLHARGRPS